MAAGRPGSSSPARSRTAARTRCSPARSGRCARTQRPPATWRPFQRILVHEFVGRAAHGGSLAHRVPEGRISSPSSPPVRGQPSEAARSSSSSRSARNSRWRSGAVRASTMRRITVPPISARRPRRSSCPAGWPAPGATQEHFGGGAAEHHPVGIGHGREGDDGRPVCSAVPCGSMGEPCPLQRSTPAANGGSPCASLRIHDRSGCETTRSLESADDRDDRALARVVALARDLVDQRVPLQAQAAPEDADHLAGRRSSMGEVTIDRGSCGITPDEGLRGLSFLARSVRRKCVPAVGRAWGSNRSCPDGCRSVRTLTRTWPSAESTKTLVERGAQDLPRLRRGARGRARAASADGDRRVDAARRLVCSPTRRDDSKGLNARRWRIRSRARRAGCAAPCRAARTPPSARRSRRSGRSWPARAAASASRPSSAVAAGPNCPIALQPAAPRGRRSDADERCGHGGRSSDNIRRRSWVWSMYFCSARCAWPFMPTISQPRRTEPFSAPVDVMRCSSKGGVDDGLGVERQAHALDGRAGPQVGACVPGQAARRADAHVEHAARGACRGWTDGGRSPSARCAFGACGTRNRLRR